MVLILRRESAWFVGSRRLAGSLCILFQDKHARLKQHREEGVCGSWPSLGVNIIWVGEMRLDWWLGWFFQHLLSSPSLFDIWLEPLRWWSVRAVYIHSSGHENCHAAQGAVCRTDVGPVRNHI